MKPLAEWHPISKPKLFSFSASESIVNPEPNHLSQNWNPNAHSNNDDGHCAQNLGEFRAQFALASIRHNGWGVGGAHKQTACFPLFAALCLHENPILFFIKQIHNNVAALPSSPPMPICKIASSLPSAFASSSDITHACQRCPSCFQKEVKPKCIPSPFQYVCRRQRNRTSASEIP